ncbi:ABC transporter permease subunit [Shewanella yunxiaonensis]|uniref:ABC transporter permease subunit n=1 Tax=Shewanella yunxiaonensis TaxID=2829809 RepID=A0ABX7YQ27_9GAMM|nr:ABC transporter permease subunit [Shewanella yunxiaonensis]QUN04717.1 ABC transporter permease subunit [Shewanella yunxiaonensis]
MESQVSKPAPESHDFLMEKRGNRRALKDQLARAGVTIGGIMVFVALLLIFFYLLYVIKPVFDAAKVIPLSSVPVATDGKTLMVGADEQNELIYRVNEQGQVDFFRVADSSKKVLSLPVPEGTKVVSSAASVPNQQLFALGLDNGQALLAGIDFSVSYPNNQRLITPGIRYPMGEPLVTVDDHGSPLQQLVFAYNSDKISFAYCGKDQHWFLTRLGGEQNMLTEEVEWQRHTVVLPNTPPVVEHQLLTPDQRQLMLQSGNKVFIYNINDVDDISLLQVLDLERAKAKVSNISLLAGASSLLVSYNSGVVAQYFQVAGEHGRLYQYIREFKGLGNIGALASEYYRKSFATVSEDGRLELLYTTSERELFSKKFDLANPVAMGFSPRSNALVVQAGDKLQLFSVSNEHPEVSWSALWNKVWYEGYPEPQYVWQSTSGSDDFEAKLSLMPLAFGTLKAAFYAMIFAVPLAIAGAIYTAYFMSAKVRSLVKPTIEIMEALPTVILGFLAGLWLAPLIEDHLPGLLLLLLLLPVTILLTAFAWSKLPVRIKALLPETYQELLLIPVICFFGWFSFAISPTIELWLFHGDTRQFITNTLGMSFDQRNALVVGIAMGFAVIPTIFSIAEDAIFSVPRHLSNGSLALGATRWQTLTRVVLLTASPGIFSAVMMGLGRAVGETMIVLMATGNTAIMDWSIFQGMRTLAANIAVEMPESAIGSSHYRVLFLAAFVLFIFTFFFNTIAEVVRQRLRERYSSL